MDANETAQNAVSARRLEFLGLDEAPTFTTRQHLEYLIGLITKQWEKTIRKRYGASGITSLPKFDEMDFLEVFDNEEDSVIRIDFSMVTKSIFYKVDSLQHMHRIGLPHLAELKELIREDLAKCSLVSLQYEEDEGNEATFFEMVSTQHYVASCVLFF
jgi:hypothetical protein